MLSPFQRLISLSLRLSTLLRLSYGVAVVVELEHFSPSTPLARLPPPGVAPACDGHPPRGVLPLHTSSVRALLYAAIGIHKLSVMYVGPLSAARLVTLVRFRGDLALSHFH